MERRAKRMAPIAGTIFFLILLSCSLSSSALARFLHIQSTNSSASAAEPARLVPFNTLLKGNHSGIRERQFLIIRSRAEWEHLWRSHSSSNLPKQELPTVDFDKESILALFSGEKRTGGYAIEVAKVKEDPQATQLKVFYRETVPPRNGIVTQELTQPFCIIKLAWNADAPVVFVPRKR